MKICLLLDDCFSGSTRRISQVTARFCSFSRGLRKSHTISIRLLVFINLGDLARLTSLSFYTPVAYRAGGVRWNRKNYIIARRVSLSPPFVTGSCFLIVILFRDHVENCCDVVSSRTKIQLLRESACPGLQINVKVDFFVILQYRSLYVRHVLYFIITTNS